MDTLQYGEARRQIIALLETARTASLRSVNAFMTASYWEVGRRIVVLEQQGEERAGYGDALIKELAKDLTSQFGGGFGWRNLTQMRGFFLGMAAGEDFADGICKIYSTGNLGQTLPSVMVGLRQTAFGEKRRGANFL